MPCTVGLVASLICGQNRRDSPAAKGYPSPKFSNIFRGIFFCFLWRNRHLWSVIQSPCNYRIPYFVIRNLCYSHSLCGHIHPILTAEALSMPPCHPLKSFTELPGALEQNADYLSVFGALHVGCNGLLQASKFVSCMDLKSIQMHRALWLRWWNADDIKEHLTGISQGVLSQ